jgi:hypothetical protein
MKDLVELVYINEMIASKHFAIISSSNFLIEKYAKISITK